VETIFARKRNGQLYRHDFERAAPLIGEPDGSLRIPGRPKKWAVIDGEPWMVNAPVEKPAKRHAGRRRKARARRARVKSNHALAVYALNRPEGKKKMARRRNKKGRFTKGAYMKRKAHGRRYGRRRAAARRSSSYRRPARRRGYRRNPPVSGFLGRLVPPIEPILTAVAGATVTRFLGNQLEGWFPNLVMGTDPKTGLPVENKMGRTMLKVAAAILAGIAGGMVLGKARGSQLAAGGLVIITDEFVRSEVLPRTGLGAFIEPYEMVETYVDPPPESGDDGMPGALSNGDMSDFMDDDFLPGRLNPSSRLN
jgi:hypothetical protein